MAMPKEAPVLTPGNPDRGVSWEVPWCVDVVQDNTLYDKNKSEFYVGM